MPNYLDPFGDGLPGPYVTLTVRWNGQTENLLALVDTGADVVQIPAAPVKNLALNQTDTMWVLNPQGEWRERPVYVADLEFEGLAFPAAEVISDEYAIALIGRVALNELIATLNGPAQTFDLHRP